MRSSTNRSSILFSALSIVAVAAIFVDAFPIVDRPDQKNNDDDLLRKNAKNSSTSAASLSTTSTGKTAPMSAGLVVALFILVLCCLIFLTCGVIWLIGRCRNMQQNQGWNEVFESLKPFPVRRIKFVSDEDDPAWQGPPPFEVYVHIPSTSDNASVSVSPLIADADPSTKIDPLDDSSSGRSKPPSRLDVSKLNTQQKEAIKRYQKLTPKIGSRTKKRSFDDDYD